LGVLPQWRKEPERIWAAYNEMFSKLLTTEEEVAVLMAQSQEQVDDVMAPELFLPLLAHN
jgi:hypothetical protein